MPNKSLAETIRSIKVGSKKTIGGFNCNTVRVTASRVLGAGNYTVAKKDDLICIVGRLA